MLINLVARKLPQHIVVTYPFDQPSVYSVFLRILQVILKTSQCNLSVFQPLLLCPFLCQLELLLLVIPDDL